MLYKAAETAAWAVVNVGSQSFLKSKVAVTRSVAPSKSILTESVVVSVSTPALISYSP